MAAGTLRGTLFALGFVFPVANAHAGDDLEAAKAFVQETAEAALVLFEHEDGRSVEANLRDLLDERFALRIIGRALVGRYWRRSTLEQQEAYLETFRDYVVRFVFSNLHVITGSEFTVIRAVRRGEREIFVYSQAVTSGEETTLIDWRLREREGDHRVVDVAIEGASVFVPMRAEFGALIQDAGMDGLIQALQDKATEIR